MIEKIAHLDFIDIDKIPYFSSFRLPGESIFQRLDISLNLNSI
jgi:hypothetical protein